MQLPQSKDAHPELCLILSVQRGQVRWHVVCCSGHVLAGRRERDPYNFTALTGPESFSSSFLPFTCSASHSNQSPWCPLLIRSNSQEVIHTVDKYEVLLDVQVLGVPLDSAVKEGGDFYTRGNCEHEPGFRTASQLPDP